MSIAQAKDIEVDKEALKKAEIERERIEKLAVQAREERAKEKVEKNASIEVQRKKKDDRIQVIESKYSSGYKGLDSNQLAEFKAREEREAKNSLAFKRDVFLDTIKNYGINSPETKKAADRYETGKSRLESVTNGSPKKLAKQTLATVRAETESTVAIARFNELFYEIELKKVTGVVVTEKETKQLAKLQKLANAASMATNGEPINVPSEVLNAREGHLSVKAAQAAMQKALVEAETLGIAEKERFGKTTLSLAGAILDDARANERMKSIRKEILNSNDSGYSRV